jgi:hypothetical protein
MLRALIVTVVLSLATLGLLLPVVAQEARPAAERTRSGFKVVVLITTDTNWRAKWNSPPETVPHLRGPGVMKVGEKGTVLVLFSNARLKDSEALLHCDLTVINPDGTSDEHPAQPCYRGPLPGGPESLHKAGLEIGFEVSPKDLTGLHGFEIGVTDVHRGVRVPVKVTVEFDTGKGAT